MTELAESWIMELRRRLSEPAPRRLPVGEQRRAAVLVPLSVEAGELWVLLVRRAEELAQHRNQIAFPGGSLETGEKPWDAALREASEEVGIESDHTLRLGELDEVETPTGFRIVPCVAVVPAPFEPTLEKGEIAEAFSLPFSALSSPRLVEHREVEIEGRARELTVFHVGNRQIWGVTATILENLLARLEIEIRRE